MRDRDSRLRRYRLQQAILLLATLLYPVDSRAQPSLAAILKRLEQLEQEQRGLRGE